MGQERHVSPLDLGVDPRSRLKSICTFQVGSDHFTLPSNRICLAPISFMSSRLGDKILAIIETVCTALSLIMFLRLPIPSLLVPSPSSTYGTPDLSLQHIYKRQQSHIDDCVWCRLPYGQVVIGWVVLGLGRNYASIYYRFRVIARFPSKVARVGYHAALFAWSYV